MAESRSDLAAALIIKVEQHIKDFRDGKDSHELCAANIAASGIVYADLLDELYPNSLDLILSPTH